MKLLLALPAIALSMALAGACGSAKRTGSSPAARIKPVASTSVSTPSASTSGSTPGASTSGGEPPPEPPPRYPGVRQYPGDSDGDADRDSDEGMRTPGHRASPADARAITAAVERYYATAVASDGRRACAMLSKGLRESVPIDYGRYGPPALHGKTCATVMSKMFSHLHPEVIAVANTFKVIEVRLEGDHGYAAMRVNVPCVRATCVLPVRRLHLVRVLVKREDDSWKIQSMLAIV